MACSLATTDKRITRIAKFYKTGKFNASEAWSRIHLIYTLNNIKHVRKTNPVRLRLENAMSFLSKKMEAEKCEI